MLYLKRIKLKQGNDMLGFAMILPALCIVIFAIIILAQLCLTRQTLEYALYTSSRAAVICEDYNTAYETMKTNAISTLQSNSFDIDAEDVECELNLVAGTTSTPGDPNSNNNITWEKGALAQCRITVHMKQKMNIGGDKMTATIYVMVERPAHLY